MNISKEELIEAVNDSGDDDIDSAKKLFLIDDNLFSKYKFLFENKKNYEYIKKVKTNTLIYSKRYYPISKDQLEMIKNYIVETQKSNESPKSGVDKANETIEAKAEISDPVKTADEQTPSLPPSSLPSPQLPPRSPLIEQDKGDEKASYALDSSDSPERDAQKRTTRQRKIVWKPSVWTCFKPRGKKDGI